jgi:L-ascorbate metabolism protein UlaG (beta-lactamase superfamily)
MYNLPNDETARHKRGWGNAYVLTIAGQRFYISGDTEDISEMRELQDIDYAFVCMNLPYTMTVEAAADAVLDFKPRVVYPFHYRGKEGFSDVDKFQQIVVAANGDIEVRLRNWYPE